MRFLWVNLAIRSNLYSHLFFGGNFSVFLTTPHTQGLIILQTGALNNLYGVNTKLIETEKK